jgi:hypothetical protein
MIGLVLIVSACSVSGASDDTTTTTASTEDTGHEGMDHDGEMAAEELIAANLATAAFQDVAMAEAAGYGSTMDGLGCFENSETGGMGLHYLNESLMDDKVDIKTPEALVYELNSDGDIVGLVAHEYIVPVEAWTDSAPPTLFGREFHQHPVLPLYVMHAWVWKDNPAGMFNDWNPAVRLCPEGVPIFGVDLP